MKYHFKVRKEGKYYWAQSIELEGCITQATSMSKLKKNMEEALNLYIQEPYDSQDVAPFPRKNIKKARNIVEVPVDPQVAFAFMVRYHRLVKYRITQNQAAKKMGFNNLYSYQRFERKKCNPTLENIFKIKKVFPEISVDYCFNP